MVPLRDKRLEGKKGVIAFGFCLRGQKTQKKKIRKAITGKKRGESASVGGKENNPLKKTAGKKSAKRLKKGAEPGFPQQTKTKKFFGGWQGPGRGTT